MRIYTKTGDKGTTGLYGDKRVPKSSAIIALVGALDTANSKLGESKSLCSSVKDSRVAIEDIISDLQHTLFRIGAEVVDVLEIYDHPITESDITRIENSIDFLAELIPPLRTFILPSGNQLACSLFSARALIRDAELKFWKADEEYKNRLLSLIRTDTKAHIWLNRCSDFLFMLARYANLSQGQKEIPWNPKHLAKNKGVLG